MVIFDLRSPTVDGVPGCVRLAFHLQLAIAPLPRTSQLLFGRSHRRQGKKSKGRHRNTNPAIGISINDLDHAPGKDLQVFPAAQMLEGMNQRG